MGIHKRKHRLHGGKKRAGFCAKTPLKPQKKLFSDTVRALPPKPAGKARDLLNDSGRISATRAE
ncbi:hypothetical protein B4099_2433 [Heyndrickxia coagulans]|uniref:Uncharacterized protein n=1 Tax=Heyndrickxia coagulans TaxID=1398 RepID=A0A150KFD5_HEYCO|nr:hypothetical protein B4099_2433 [Heyndrickxia coagulans]